MKKILIVIILFSVNFIFAQENSKSELSWVTDFETAKQQAKTDNKPILIFFTESKWCELCNTFDKDFIKSKRFITIAKDKLVLYKAFFPRKKSLVSAKQKQINIHLDSTYSKTRAKRSFPTIVFVDATGKELGFLESYNYIHDTSRHFGLLEAILKKY